MTGRGMQRSEGPLQKHYSPFLLTSTSTQPTQEGSALHPGSSPGQCKHHLAHLGLPHLMIKANLVPSILTGPDAIQELHRCHCAEMVQVPSPEVADDGVLNLGGSWPLPASSSMSIRCSVLPVTVAHYTVTGS